MALHRTPLLPLTRGFAFLLVLLAGSGPASVRAAVPAPNAGIPQNWRNITSGWTIPDEEYADQPYIVKCDDGAWLCVITTSDGHEGATSQHIVATRSTDFGRTWSPLIAVEPPGPPESSYVTILKTPTGRIFAFYNYNKDNLRAVQRIDGTMEKRVDTLGAFVFKFSDDHGKTWSPRHYEIAVRETAIDRANVYQGKTRFFWHVGRPLLHRGAAYVTLHKVGNFGPMFIDSSEGTFLRSDNLVTERDPEKIRWETLPDGDVGVRARSGKIAEEHSLVALSDGSLFTAFRTATDHPGHAYSRDGGRSWTAPADMTYGPGGRVVKHTRAATFVWKTSNGRYLYWYHNHGGFTYSNQRNPAWLAAGREVDTPAGKAIAWSEPEILLYDDDNGVRMSYPDFGEDGGRYFFTETQKTIARVHEVPRSFIEQLLNQHVAKAVAMDGLALDLSAETLAAAKTVARPALPDLAPTKEGVEGGGFTLEFWVKFRALEPGQTLVDSRDANGNGFALTTTERGTVQLSLRGPYGPSGTGGYGAGVQDFGLGETSWDCDPARLKPGTWHHVAVVVDGGSRIISFVIDGQLHDGGDRRQFGWARFPRELRTVAVHDKLTLASHLSGEMKGFRLYHRALLTSEVIGNWRAGVGR